MMWNTKYQMNEKIQIKDVDRYIYYTGSDDYSYSKWQ